MIGCNSVRVSVRVSVSTPLVVVAFEIYAQNQDRATRLKYKVLPDVSKIFSKKCQI